MFEKAIRQYVQELFLNSGQEERVKKALKGFAELFSFGRATLFTYSPINHVGEGVLRLDHTGFHPMRYIREDVRQIPPVQAAIARRKPEFVKQAGEDNLFPMRYVEEFHLQSVVIVPIAHRNHTLGCAILDQYEGVASIEKCFEALLQYGHWVGALLSSPFLPVKWFPLSNREQEVIQRLSWGESIKEMANEMGIRECTVQEYIQTAMKKMGVQNRAQAVADAIRYGLIQ